MESAIKNIQQVIEARLESFISNSQIEGVLLEAIQHAVFPAGKRIRPLISLLLAQDLKLPTELILNQSLAVELLHCSSLIHDDLPALDNDDLRRGRPSCHKAFGEATAILAGDALIALAFEIASKINHNHNFESSGKATVSVALTSISLIAEAFKAVCRGQQLDLLNHKELERMQLLKTGALFAVSCKLPSLYFTDNQLLINSFENFGYSLGAFFQYADDYLDVWGSDAVRGRNQSSDLKNSKITRVEGLSKDYVRNDLSLLFKELNSQLLALAKQISKCEGINTDFTGIKSVVSNIHKRLEEY